MFGVECLATGKNCTPYKVDNLAHLDVCCRRGRRLFAVWLVGGFGGSWTGVDCSGLCERENRRSDAAVSPSLREERRLGSTRLTRYRLGVRSHEESRQRDEVHSPGWLFKQPRP